MDFNIEKLMYYFFKLYKSPSFDRFIDFEHVENNIVLLFVTKLFFLLKKNSFFFTI